MYSTGCIRVNLGRNGKSIPHSSHPLEPRSLPVFPHNAFYLPYTNERSFKFRRWPPRRWSQKQLHPSPGMRPLFEATCSSSSGGGRQQYDWYGARGDARLANGDSKWIRLLLSNKFTCEGSCESCSVLILQWAWKGYKFCTISLWFNHL